MWLINGPIYILKSVYAPPVILLYRVDIMKLICDIMWNLRSKSSSFYSCRYFIILLGIDCICNIASIQWIMMQK